MAPTRLLLSALIATLSFLAPLCDMPRRSKVMSAPDSFLMGYNPRSDGFDNNRGYSVAGSKTVRAISLNTGIRNLVLITAGQSNLASVGPTAYTPTNAAVLDNFSVYSGLNYAAADPLLGSTFHPLLGSGVVGGGVSLRLADLLVTNGKFDRVFIVPIAMGGTAISQWRSGGALYGNIAATMARLADRGLAPGTTGVTYAFVWGHGESDTTLATTQATYQAGLGEVLTTLFTTGFDGRAFINQQTWNAGTTSSAIRAAQAAVVNGTTIFAGADADTLDATKRQADNVHFNDTGMSDFATLMYNAMHASGAPY